MRALLVSSLDAVVVANGKITKFSSQLFVALKQVPANLRQALNPLAERGKDALEKIRALLASSLDAVVVANGKITKFSSQLFVTLKQVPANLRQALNPARGTGKGCSRENPKTTGGTSRKGE
jgi:hypothetical protein